MLGAAALGGKAVVYKRKLLEAMHMETDGPARCELLGALCASDACSAEDAAAMLRDEYTPVLTVAVQRCAGRTPVA